jgi:hypothetical protein
MLEPAYRWLCLNGRQVRRGHSQGLGRISHGDIASMMLKSDFVRFIAWLCHYSMRYPYTFLVILCISAYNAFWKNVASLLYRSSNALRFSSFFRSARAAAQPWNMFV